MVTFPGFFQIVFFFRGDRLKDLIVEHTSFLQYVNDLAELNVEPLKGCLRELFVSGFISPAIIQPVLKTAGTLNINSEGNCSSPRQFCSELICSLLLFNLVALNLTDLVLFLPETDIDMLLAALSRCMMIYFKGETLSQDDRYPLLMLTLFTTLHQQTVAHKVSIPESMREFMTSQIVPSLIRFIHHVPQAGA